jgi:hypothetical protein
MFTGKLGTNGVLLNGDLFKLDAIGSGNDFSSEGNYIDLFYIALRSFLFTSVIKAVPPIGLGLSFSSIYSLNLEYCDYNRIFCLRVC